ncbi:hypothetical protein Taro_037582 [Colocasia esculenta]|uniref:DUF674 family protein n=1 Tax=Colocasia esculenta TaxID=4460 RepID=A0A843WL67_COLES|nr:hypothetical protein [Colocasia esculenta]
MSRHKNLSLVLVVDKQANRVLWAESGGDVVDVLFSFLTLPLGTVVRVLGKQSGLGCVDELYKSVEALDESCFQTPCCKSMLLRPRSAAERLCEDLPVKVDDSDLTLYTCSNESCIEHKYPSVFSSVKGTHCRCLGATDRTQKGLTGCGILKESGQLEHMKVELSRERVLTLLQKSLTSKTPLTDTFLQKSECQPKEQLHPISTHEEVTDSGREFKARLVRSRARNEVMYAEIGEDMADLLFSFLTIPLGSIIRLMEKASHIGCMDNLYQSVANLCAVKYCAKLEKHRDMLLAPKIATHFGCSNQLLDIDETSFQTNMSKCASTYCAKIHVPPVCTHGIVAQTALQINPKLLNGSTGKGGNFAKGMPGTFMVTDEMMVMPNSSASGLKFMKGRNVYVDDIDLRDAAVGKKKPKASEHALAARRPGVSKGRLRTSINPFEQGTVYRVDHTPARASYGLSPGIVPFLSTGHRAACPVTERDPARSHMTRGLLATLHLLQTVITMA